MSKIKGNQDAVKVSSILGMDILKHYDISFRGRCIFTTSLR
jgi:hypothetical protein